MTNSSTSSAHTPGPWLASVSHCEEIYGLDKHDCVESRSAGQLVADICPTGDDEESAANARIIAAAPELLRYLKCIVEIAQSVSANWESGDLAHAVRSLDRIASAAQAIIERVA